MVLYSERNMEEQQASTSGYGEDVLTKALGKKDHRGFVKVLGRSGAGLGLKKVFGKPRRESWQTQMQATFAQSQAESQAQIAELKAELAQMAELKAQIAQVSEIKAQMAQMQAMLGMQLVVPPSQVPLAYRPPTMESLVPQCTRTDPTPPVNVCFLRISIILHFYYMF